MNEKLIHDSIIQEMGRNLEARIQRNSGNINLQDAIKEAIYSLAINVIITQRRLKEQTGGQMQMVPQLTLEYMFEGMKKAMVTYFPKYYKEIHFELIEAGYQKLMADSNAIDLINNHYNELYQDYSSNIL